MFYLSLYASQHAYPVWGKLPKQSRQLSESNSRLSVIRTLISEGGDINPNTAIKLYIFSTLGVFRILSSSFDNSPPTKRIKLQRIQNNALKKAHKLPRYYPTNNLHKLRIVRNSYRKTHKASK